MKKCVFIIILITITYIPRNGFVLGLRGRDLISFPRKAFQT